MMDHMDTVENTSDVHVQDVSTTLSTSTPTASPHVDLEDEVECRVCRGEAEPDRRLHAPCKCSGSIRFTHSDCLSEWLAHSGKTFCELCGHKFDFKPLYDANAPDVLSWKELMTTIGQMTCRKWIPFGFRAILVLFMWLGIAPWCTSWLYRMWLLRASAMVNVNFSERFDMEHVLTDVFGGIVVIVVIIFSFMAFMSFADFLRFHLDHIEEPVEEEVMVNVPFVAPNPRRPIVPEGWNVDGVLLDHEDGEVVEGRGRRLGVMPNIEWNAIEDDVVQPEEGQAVRQDDVLMLPPPPRVRQDDDAVAAVLRHRRNLARNADEGVERPAPIAPARIAAPPPAAPLPRPMPRPQPRMNPNPNRPNNEMWEDDLDHMEINIAMDELLGLRGDFMVVFRNVSWLLAFNGAYLGLFAFIPYTLGSTIVSASGKILSSLGGASILESMMVTEASGEVNLVSFIVQTLSQSMENARKRGDCLQLVDLCTCAVGYVSICCTIILWRWMVTTASSYIHRPLMGGLLWALRCLTAIVKVSTLLSLKMIVLPIVLGCGMDMATLRLFGITIYDRITFCMENMVGSLLVHWVLGITFMLFVTVSVLQLREVLHPDILSRVIRPQEAHPDLLRSLLSEKCVKHARRMVLSLCIYAVLLLMLVYLPIRFIEAVHAIHFPIVLRFQHYIPELQVPVELLIAHLVVLGVLESAKDTIGNWQHTGVIRVARMVGLTEYLLPRIEVNWTDLRFGTKRGDIHILPPPPLHFHPHVELPVEQLRVPGRRYLPWPEEGPTFGPPTQIEYENILPRSKPDHLSLRVAALCLILWVLVAKIIVIAVFGTVYIGRLCMGPFERLTGITHDPLALAVGVQIVWFLASSAHALDMLSLPQERVERALVQRGYCIKNVTTSNVITSVLGWVVGIPYLVGSILQLSLPQANWTMMETFWVGYLLFNYFVWFVCCFHVRGRRRRALFRNRRDPNGARGGQGPVVDDLDEMDVDDEDLNDGDEDEEDEAADREGDADVVDVPVEEPVNIFVALRTSYKQLRFNINVHENDRVRLRSDNIADHCLDLKQFVDHVIHPIAFHLLLLVLFGILESSLLMYFHGEVNSLLYKTAFAISVVSGGSLLLIWKAHGYFVQGLRTFSENLRNERYLIGRELQDMAR